MDLDPVSLLPSSWQPYAHAIAGLIAAFSALAALIKPALGAPSPRDPVWKTMLFGVLHVLDLLAANTQTVRSKAEIAKLKRESMP